MIQRYDYLQQKWIPFANYNEWIRDPNNARYRDQYDADGRYLPPYRRNRN